MERGTAGGNDGQDTELGLHLNATTADSETGGRNGRTGVIVYRPGLRVVEERYDPSRRGAIPGGARKVWLRKARVS